MEPATQPSVGVALTLRAGSTVDGETVRDVAVTYLGTNLGADPQWPVVNFAGVAGPASADRHAATPVTYDGSPDDTWPADMNGSMFRTLTDDVLPSFVYEDDRSTSLASDGTSRILVSDVGISGTSVPVVWELVSVDEHDLVVRVDSDFEQEDIHRGYRFVTTGNVSGEFRVARSNGMDVEGRLDIVFDLVDDQGEVPLHQWWEAAPAPEPPDPDTWRTGLGGIERFSDVRAEPDADPDSFQTRFGHGGANWAGLLDIELFSTQASRTPEPMTVRTVLDVDSRFTVDGQWLSANLSEWEATGPPFTTADEGASSVAGDAPPFALIVAADGRISDAYPASTDELVSRDLRIWFGQLLLEALPSFPDTPLGPGSRWQSRVQGEQDGAGPEYTLVDVVGDELHLDVGGSFGAYFGDRYDGYSVTAEIAGTIVVHWAAAIPLDVDIETTGTITFGTGGVPDPSTSEPWRSTLRIRAIPASE